MEDVGGKEELMKDLKQLGEVGTETSKHLEGRISSLPKQDRRKLMILNTNSL